VYNDRPDRIQRGDVASEQEIRRTGNNILSVSLGVTSIHFTTLEIYQGQAQGRPTESLWQQSTADTDSHMFLLVSQALSPGLHPRDCRIVSHVGSNSDMLAVLHSIFYVFSTYVGLNFASQQISSGLIFLPRP
jgi:hypothetical protein